MAWVGAGRRGKVVIGAVHLAWAGMVARGLKESLIYPGQPSNQGLPINPTRRVLRGFKGGNGPVSSECGAHLGLRLHRNDGLADLAVLFTLLQSLGLPEEVLEVVRARVAVAISSQEGFSV